LRVPIIILFSNINESIRAKYIAACTILSRKGMIGIFNRENESEPVKLRYIITAATDIEIKFFLNIMRFVQN
jgi:hypothetical protein